MTMKKSLTTILLILSLGLSGCTGLLVGGTVAGIAAMHDRRTVGTVVDDRVLQIKLAEKLFSDATIKSSSHTNIAVFNGVVLVTGEVSSETIIERIEKLIQSSPSVKRLQTYLSVRSPSSMLERSKDALITAKVKATLLQLNMKNFDPTLIKVVTERGEVYVMGMVTRQEALSITLKTKTVSGVRKVIEVFEYLD